MKKTLAPHVCIAVSAAAAIGLSYLAGCSDVPELQVYSWSDYFEPESLALFEETYRCKVVVTTFDSNEAMYAKLKSGGTGYDLIVPSSYLIPTLVRDGLLSKIDHAKIQNVAKNFDRALDGQVLDPSFTWSVPYACTYTGLMYDRKRVQDAEVRSWSVLSDPKYARHISLLDDVRELVGIGLILSGRSVNETDETAVMDAARRVASLRRSVRKFDAEAYKNDVASGSIWIGHGYSSDAAQVMIGEDRSDIGFSLPDEGFVIAWDEFVIPKDARNKDLAHAFINFFYDDLVAISNLKYICSLVPNRYAMRKMPEDYRKVLLPDNLSRGQLLKGFDDPSAFDLYNRALDVIKATDGKDR